jgi:hypothetical protein
VTDEWLVQTEATLAAVAKARGVTPDVARHQYAPEVREVREKARVQVGLSAYSSAEMEAASLAVAEARGPRLDCSRQQRAAEVRRVCQIACEQAIARGTTFTQEVVDVARAIAGHTPYRISTRSRPHAPPPPRSRGCRPRTR